MTPVLYIHISMLLFSLDLCTSSPKSHPTEAFITKQSGDSFFLGSTLSNLEVWPEIQRLGQNVGSSQIEEVLCGNGLPLLCFFQCFWRLRMWDHTSHLSCFSRIDVCHWFKNPGCHWTFHVAEVPSCWSIYVHLFICKFLVLFGNTCVMYVSLGSLIS